MSCLRGTRAGDLLRRAAPRDIRREDIPIVPLYCAKARSVVEREGAFIMADDECIANDYREFSGHIALRDVLYIPVSALGGDNLTMPSANTPWYRRSALMEHWRRLKPIATRTNASR